MEKKNSIYWDRNYQLQVGRLLTHLPCKTTVKAAAKLYMCAQIAGFGYAAGEEFIGL